MIQPISAIFGNGVAHHHQSALEKQGSCSSLATAATEILAESFLDLSGHSIALLEDDDDRHGKSVTFEFDEYENIRETVHEYPAIEEQDKDTLFWTMDEVAARTMERNVMVHDECQERSRFITCVEELFDVPMQKRHDNGGDPVTMSKEMAIEALVSSEYRGYEIRCCRIARSARKRAIRQVLAAHWVRGGKETHEVAANVSQKQVKFAYLVAQGDARIAAQF